MRDDPRQTDDEGLEPTRPPERFDRLREWVLTDPGDLSRVRRELLEEITAVHAEEQNSLLGIPERMILVASELATNALNHGLPPTIVRLMTDGRTFLIDVADHDLSSAPRVAGQRPPGRGGFGLQIARRLSQQVGWYATESTKHVWATFDPQG